MEFGRHLRHSTTSGNYVIPTGYGLQSMGGVRWMVLSHKDDVADHARWARELGCKRIIHSDETTRSQGTE